MAPWTTVNADYKVSICHTPTDAPVERRTGTIPLILCLSIAPFNPMNRDIVTPFQEASASQSLVSLIDDVPIRSDAIAANCPF
jgi:hypothetical protein